MAIAVLSGIGVAAYASSFSGQFLFDDVRHIVENPQIRDLSHLGEILSHRRPAVNLSLAVNYALGGLDVWGYHLWNLLVHLLASLTLFGIVRRTLLGYPFRTFGSESATYVALATALIWVVHPIQTQSVTYVVQRGESMMGLFYLLTLYCVIRGVKSPFRRFWHSVAVMACAVGMGCKAVIVTVPVVVLLYDYVFLARSFRVAMRRRWGLYLALASTWLILGASGVVTGVLAPPRGVSATVGFGYQGVTPSAYLATQFGVILHYLKLSLWPSSLCLDYWWPVARTAGAIVWPGTLITGLFAATCWMIVRKSWAGFLGGWFFLVLAPTSSFIPIKDLAFEHRMYLPLAAVVVCAVVSGQTLLGRLHTLNGLGPATAMAIGGGWVATIVGVLGYLTMQRNGVYHSSLAMWSDVVAKRPDNPRAHSDLGMALAATGDLDQAIDQYRLSLSLAPRYATAHNNLGNALVKRDELEEGISHIREALDLRPRFAKAHNNLGVALAKQGRFTEAGECYSNALKYNPDYPDALRNLGNILLKKGKLAEAIERYEAALDHDPTHSEAHNSLAAALIESGQIDQAIGHCKTALDLRANFPEAHNNLGVAYLRQHRPSDAIACFVEALTIRPNYVDARENLTDVMAREGKIDRILGDYASMLPLNSIAARAYVKRGEAAVQAGNSLAALQAYEEALRVDPTSVRARVQRGRVLRTVGQTEEAISEFREAIGRDPEYLSAYKNLAYDLANQGMSDEAIDTYRVMLRIRPDAETYSNIAILLLQQGNLAEAADQCRQALLLAPNHTNARYTLAYTLEQQGELHDAIDQYREVLRLAPDHTRAEQRLQAASAREQATSEIDGGSR